MLGMLIDAWNAGKEGAIPSTDVVDLSDATFRYDRPEARLQEKRLAKLCGPGGR
jgi:hypothetical protein